MVLTNIADSEAPLVGAVVGGPAHQELVAGAGDVEGRGQVSAQRGQGGAVGSGAWGGETKEDKVEGRTGGLRGGWVRHLTNV